MRLSQIEKPKSLLARYGYRKMRKQFGKVLTPLKVLYARRPALMPLAQHITWVCDRLTLPPALRLLIQAGASRWNGCRFCQDFRGALNQRCGLAPERLAALENFRTSPVYDARERAALAYVQEIARQRQSSDATFDELQRRFTDEEIVEITWLVAAETYYNLLMMPLGIESDGLCQLA